MAEQVIVNVYTLEGRPQDFLIQFSTLEEAQTWLEDNAGNLESMMMDAEVTTDYLLFNSPAEFDAYMTEEA